MYTIGKIIWALLIFLPLVISAQQMTSENYIISADSINAAGNRSTSTSYVLTDAAGEVAIGNSTSTNYTEEVFITSYLFRVFSLTSPSSVSLSPKTVSIASQTATGTISNVEVIDDGTAGWSLTMTSTHLTSSSTVKDLSGSNSTVDFTGTYDGLDGVLDPNGTFIVEITTGGSVGTAVFKWDDPAGNQTTTVTTASSVTLSNGISATFAAATYVIGDKWSAGVDTFPYTGLTITPGSVTVVSGDGGVTAGSAALLTGSGVTSDAKTLMIGDANDSSGTYRQNEDVELVIHANSLPETFRGDATLTII